MIEQTENWKDQFRYQSVEQHIMGLIESGTLGRGDKLPSLRTLSRTMSLSISTISQAYVELEKKGVVESRPRSGFFVRASSHRLPAPTRCDPTPAEPKRVSRNKLILTVLETVGNKEIVPLGVICPGTELLPGKSMARIMNQVVRENADTSLAYETVSGNPELRRQLAFQALERGDRFGPDDMIITNGAIEAVYITLRSLTRPGDIVCIQSPSYYCFLQLLETLGLRVVEISSCPNYGIDPAELREVLDKYDIRACIFSPNFNNPDGSLTPDDAKKEIVSMLAERDIPLVEDDVAGDLHFGPVRPATFKHFDERGLVVLCSSFSKTIAPGYRIGWMVPGRFRDKALEIKATTNVCGASPTQMAVAEFLRQGLYERHIKRLRAAFAKQADTMHLHMGRHFPPGTRVTRPQGGMVLWVELPESVDSVKYFYAAKAEGVGIAPGSIFSTQNKFNNFIRLSCGGAWTPEIENGLSVLGDIATGMAR
ncbi:DNA-binding transcriptional MocR family regulator [Desulfobaculum xiamenense]|uniref:DNA-binding transcriptional MocR family regulator n=1 Tax=Desulfobaculum xiamenense TaxID=995050 RepID=A0A846QME6_9BACT|nr:PLP-dependent aminotransferase family protein [Desulfobaculum xiamenense]NJB68357.1 DNA-binding transcriptional MocR family regulator [Desulfobaculum xiamenense]